MADSPEYNKLMIITPLSMLPNKRNDKDTGVAMSPNKLMGNSNGNGSKNPFK